MQDGDMITIDAETNRIDVDVTDDELAERKRGLESPALQGDPRHALQVHQERETATEGCVTDE